MQPLAVCLTHHFPRPVSGRPIVCHDGKDTNFIAYLQANRNIFYDGGNATQCLLPTAARHPYFASKRGRCSHGRRAQTQPQPKASQPATCRSLRHRPATSAVWQPETGRTAMQDGPYGRAKQARRRGRPASVNKRYRRHCGGLGALRPQKPAHGYSPEAYW